MPVPECFPLVKIFPQNPPTNAHGRRITQSLQAQGPGFALSQPTKNFQGHGH